jgi:hypothetical protein
MITFSSNFLNKYPEMTNFILISRFPRPLMLSKHITCIHEEAIPPRIHHLKDPMYLLKQIGVHSWFAIPKHKPSAC